MYCKKCGKELSDGSKFCPYCGYDQQAVYYPSSRQKTARPKNYLWLSILAIIFCCQPFGIVSLIFALKVDSSYNSGNIEAAMDYSSKARKWGIWGIVINVIIYILYFALVIAGIVGTELFDKAESFTCFLAR